MKLKISPTLIFSILVGFMVLLAKYLPIGRFAFFGSIAVIGFLSFLGVLLSTLALVQFIKNKTTVNPKEPLKTSKLITSGVYKYSRNPMYLVLLLLLIAISLYLKNAFNLFLVVGFVSYMNVNQIIPEEEALTQIFGSSYKSYCKKVRRWF